MTTVVIRDLVWYVLALCGLLIVCREQNASGIRIVGLLVMIVCGALLLGTMYYSF